MCNPSHTKQNRQNFSKNHQEYRIKKPADFGGFTIHVLPDLIVRGVTAAAWSVIRLIRIRAHMIGTILP